ncbi:MAG: hypothetical protein H6807_06240 [Planctomycetes bacterium]|nr:hypothetical protein [Planctomycetota bacterium]
MPQTRSSPPKAGDEATAPRPPAGDLLRLLIVALQVGLWAVVVQHFHLLEARLLSSLAIWLLPAFLIHAVLPRRFRKAFFVLVALATLLEVAGLGEGAVLIGVGLGLIGLCHLPIPYYGRVGLVALATLALAAVRAELVTPPGPQETWLALMPIFASIFMFRLVVYLYDLKHMKANDGLWHRLAYFFMPPSPFFAMYPVVDYKAFGKHWYDRPATDIYQKGCHWMFRGVTHLLFYRLIYFHVAPTPSEVDGAASFVLYVFSSYLLYTRISGEFHTIIGVLALFGYNLPESHHYFFLARSFSDVWRRINIYWRDFMMKIAFYPTYFRLKKLPTVTAVTIATLVAFFATWFFHAWQFFWLRGTWLLQATDMTFWGALAILVLGSALRQLKAAKAARKPADAPWSLAEALRVTRSASIVFVSMCCLLSYWSCNRPGDWFGMFGLAFRDGLLLAPAFWLLVLGVPTLGVLLHLGAHLRDRRFGRGPLAFGPKATLVLSGGLLIALLGQPALHRRLPDEMATFLRSLTQDSFRQSDVELMERGYYENLLGTDRFTSHLWDLQMQRPSDWVPFADSEFAEPIDDEILQYRIKAGVDGIFHRVPFITNRWGMRDRDYEETKPEGALRIVLYGSSYAVGSGVEQEDAWEKRTERWLNEEKAGGRYSSYEILNLAVPGYTTVHRALFARRTMARFAPDIVLVTLLDRDDSFTASRLVRPIRRGARLPAELEDVRRRAGIDRDTPEDQAIARLRPFVDEIVLWSWRMIEEDCRKLGARPVLVAMMTEREGADHDACKRLCRLAREQTGLFVLELEGIWGDHDPRKLNVAPWDRHPNSFGHQLMAEALIKALEAEGEALGLGLKN